MDPEDAAYWDAWNRDWRFRDDMDAFMARVAAEVRNAINGMSGKVLDVGCGTGWLGHQLVDVGPVWGTDLSAAAIEDGRHRFPDITLLCTDFLTVELPGPFAVVVSVDAMAPMADHGAFVERVASLQRPGGLLVLMTQNPWIWRRRSRLAPIQGVPHAAVDEWPSRRRVTELLRTFYRIESVSSFAPGGDRGVLWWVENRWIRGGMGRVIGPARWERWLERIGLGRELVIVARRTA